MSKRPSYRRPSKAARRAALAELLAGLPEPPELPEEAEADDRSNGGSAITSKPITIVQDGQELHGTTWVKPEDFAIEEVQRNELPSLKGTTPLTLPWLDAEDTGEGGVYP